MLLLVTHSAYIVFPIKEILAFVYYGSIVNNRPQKYV